MSREKVKQLVCTIADVLDELMDELGIDDVPSGGDPDWYRAADDSDDEEEDGRSTRDAVSTLVGLAGWQTPKSQTRSTPN